MIAAFLKISSATTSNSGSELRYLDDAVGDPPANVRIVEDAENCRTFALARLDQLHDCGSIYVVESGGGLVEK
jgi:hypothetical protein